MLPRERWSVTATLGLFAVATLLLVDRADASDDNPITSRFKCRPNGCCDHHEWCRFWASVGECKTNQEWMEDNCQLACGTCRKTLGTSARPAPFTTRFTTRVTSPATTPATTRRITQQFVPRFTTRRLPPLTTQSTSTPSTTTTTFTTTPTTTTRTTTAPTTTTTSRRLPFFFTTQSPQTRASIRFTQRITLRPTTPRPPPPPTRSPSPSTATPSSTTRDLGADLLELRRQLIKVKLVSPEGAPPTTEEPATEAPTTTTPRAPIFPSTSTTTTRHPALMPLTSARPANFSPALMPLTTPRFAGLSRQVQTNRITPFPFSSTSPSSTTQSPISVHHLSVGSTAATAPSSTATTNRLIITTTPRPPPTAGFFRGQSFSTTFFQTQTPFQPTTTTPSTTTSTTTPAPTTTTRTTTQPSTTTQTTTTPTTTTTQTTTTTTTTTPPPTTTQTTTTSTEPLVNSQPDDDFFFTVTRPPFRQTQPFFTTTTTRFTTPFTTTQTTTPTTTTTQQTTTTTQDQFRERSPLDRCREIMERPENAAEDLIRENLIFPVEDQSGRHPLDLDTVIRSNLANACVPRNDEAECDRSLCYNLYFRTFDGTCNNFANPLQGSAFRPYNRLLKPEYDNQISEPVASLNRNLRPNPREITRKLTSSSEVVLSQEFNAFLMQFGQFTSHDLAKTTLVPSSKCNVCQNITGRCMSVDIGRDDQNRNFQNNRCIRVSRSSPICGSGNRLPRQQLNENSGYIDASPIYGSSVHDSKKFRNGNTGFLRLNQFNGMQTLPFDMTKCRNRNDCTAIFTAGDSRVNLFVGLGTFHIIMTKEHNRIASQLQRINPHWNGDRVFMESRKIVGAEVQAILYREYLPKILGAAFATHVGEYHGYDPNEDATLVNEFTSAAFRFGHGMIQETYARLDDRFSNHTFGTMDFVKGTLHSDVLLFEGGIDPMMRGMMMQRVKRPQRVTRTVTENMFGSTDLSTINIQRGRDHGHASYNRFRELCGMGRAFTFDHFSREILSTSVRNRMREVYVNPDRVDLWVGGLLEDPVVRGLVGPTIACIIGPQFKRTRDGDRLYYENPGVFTRAQLAEIRRSSLSRILCDNGNNIHSVPREAFRVGRMVPCSQIPRMDLNRWRE